MKRMIDGLINCSVKTGYIEEDGETNVNVSFDFPKWYYPISISSKPFSILPGRINWGDETTNLSDICFGEDGFSAISVIFYAGNMNDPLYSVNTITFAFKFGNKTNKDKFLKSLFGTIEEGTHDFITPISMVLCKFYGYSSY